MPQIGKRQRGRMDERTAPHTRISSSRRPAVPPKHNRSIAPNESRWIPMLHRHLTPRWSTDGTVAGSAECNACDRAIEAIAQCEGGFRVRPTMGRTKIQALMSSFEASQMATRDLGHLGWCFISLWTSGASAVHNRQVRIGLSLGVIASRPVPLVGRHPCEAMTPERPR